MAEEIEKTQNMRTIRVELPDGRLLKIEGGDAESTAKLLVNHYLGQGPVAAENDAEDVLPVPGLGDCHESSKSGSGGLGRQPEPAAIRQPDGPIRNVPVSNEGDESPLEVPAMKF